MTDLEWNVLRSRDDLARALSDVADRRAYELAIEDRHRREESWELAGYCQACRGASCFQVDWLCSDGTRVNFRERLVCPVCGLNNRQRFIAHLLHESIRPDGAVYLHEQVTPFYGWATRSLANVTGSEYLGPEVRGGTEIDGVRHEDALDLSFPDRSFDLLASNDVLEHVPDIDRALAEAARVLRPGARMLFSIPFYADRDHTVARAAVVDGRLVEMLEPQYHGNPVDPEGSRFSSTMAGTSWTVAAARASGTLTPWGTGARCTATWATGCR